ncbi:MAG: flippase-like domain-containing protein [Bacteroidota bacterium]|nr:flippase-like domain-containing protein [Bacteroidota bacterium]
MKTSVSKVLQYIFWLGIAAALLYFCLRGVDWDEFWEQLRHCRWGWVVLSMGLGAVVFWLRALRWRMMLLPLDETTSRTTCFNAINIGYLVGNVLSRVSELVRCGYVVRHSARDEEGRRKASFDRVLGTVVVDRVWDALTLFLLLGVMLALLWNRYGRMLGETLFGNATSSLVVWGLLFGLLVLGILGCWLVWRLRERSRFCGKLWGFVRGMLEGFKACLRMKGAWKFFALTAGIWALYWGMISCIVLALPLPELAGIGPLDTLLLMLVGSIVAIIPVPGAFGTYHAAIALALSAICGLPYADFAAVGILFATLSHESQLLTQVLFGTGSFLHESFRR